MEQLKQRLPWFDADDPRHVALLHEEQPEGGLVDGRPAVVMRNHVVWFWNREARPTNAEGAVMKARAPVGYRRLLCDDPSQAELLLVEGEGDAMAAITAGLAGVVVAGGVNNLVGDSEAAVKDRALLFKDKRVRILFDPDEAGASTRVAVAREVLAAGAAKVALVDMPSESDLEDWLGEFESREAARVALSNLLASVDWATEKKLEKAEAEAKKKAKEAERWVQSERVRVAGDPQPRLVVMTWEREKGRAGLAVFGPTAEPAAPQYGDVDWEGVTRGWMLAKEWAHEGHTYRPDASPGTLVYLENGTLVLPPPPATESWSSSELWMNLLRYMQKWVLMSRPSYSLAVAYVFMTWRLEDCAFKQLPYLRVYGPSGCGKGRALDVLQQVLWRSFATHPSNRNLHRIVDFFGDITLVVDEFHLAGMRESNRDVIDALCLGFDRSKGGVARVEEAKGGGPARIRHFRLFGPKVLAGYGVDEDEALARRTATIHMERVPEGGLPPEMDVLDLPDEFYAEGEQLRAQLLAWRGRKLGHGRPNAQAPEVRELQRRAQSQVAQSFFPLVTMVPKDLPQELEYVLQCAEERRAEVIETRRLSDVARMVQALVACAENSACFRVTNRVDGSTTYYVTAADVAEQAGERDVGMVGRKLREALNLKSVRRRVNGKQSRVIPLAVNDTQLARTLKDYGITWPPQDGGPEEEPAL